MDKTRWQIRVNNAGQQYLYDIIQKRRPTLGEIAAMLNITGAFICDDQSGDGNDDRWNTDGWLPIETFRTYSPMFCLVTGGNADMTEVLKYKGEIPEWVTHWMMLPKSITEG